MRASFLDCLQHLLVGFVRPGIEPEPDIQIQVVGKKDQLTLLTFCGQLDIAESTRLLELIDRLEKSRQIVYSAA